MKKKHEELAEEKMVALAREWSDLFFEEKNLKRQINIPKPWLKLEPEMQAVGLSLMKAGALLGFYSGLKFKDLSNH